MVSVNMTNIVQIPLAKSPKQIKSGYGDLTATMDAGLARDTGVLDHEWRLVARWGSQPVWAAEAHIKTYTGKRPKIQLHRFILGLHTRSPDKPKIFVIPRDGNALNCRLDNLQQLTQEEWESRKHRSSGTLTEEQQSWLDAECDRTGLGKWGVVGALIQERLPNPFDD